MTIELDRFRSITWREKQNRAKRRLSAIPRNIPNVGRIEPDLGVRV